MKIYLDSTDNTNVIIRLNDQEFVKSVASPRDQDILGFLYECLDKSGHNPQDISEVEVKLGPGSFTGCRVSVAIANAIGFSLGVPVNGQHKPVQPVYQQQPLITKPIVAVLSQTDMP